MITRLSDEAWYPNGSESLLCLLPWRMAEMQARFGIEFMPPSAQCKAPAHAVVQVDGYVLRLAAQSSEDRVRVSVRGDVQTPGRCLPVLCQALNIPVAQLPWVSNDLSAKPWLLTRLDDNGNRLPMWYFREREAAEAVARDYAARGHKQTYEVERV